MCCIGGSAPVKDGIPSGGKEHVYCTVRLVRFTAITCNVVVGSWALHNIIIAVCIIRGIMSSLTN